ncbi:MAG: hypothetical protein H6Q85_2911, partial [candidate division NC10 bacterium]|nr:hypothetical protein [candidate division NC10 bacterium]
MMAREARPKRPRSNQEIAPPRYPSSVTAQARVPTISEPKANRIHQKQCAAADVDEPRRELDGQIRLDGHGDDDADGRDGDRDLCRLFSHIFDHRTQRVQGGAATPSEKPGDKGHRGSHQRRVRGRVAEDQEQNEDHGRQEEMQARQDRLRGGQLVGAETADPRPAGAKVHDHEEGKVVGDGGDGACQGNPAVGHLEQFSHDEGGDAHDGWHELPSGRSDGLVCPGILRRVAGLLHQGNGEHPGGHHVGDGAAADRPEQRARDDGRF